MNDTRHAYLYARILLAVSVALSLACNAAHAYLNADTVPIALALGVGTIPPLVLALSVEAVIFCARSARWAWGWAAVTLAAGAGLVTGFAMSFAAISDLGRMAHMTAVTAPMLPVSIDALVITGLGMVALFRPGASLDALASPADAPVDSADSPADSAPSATPADGLDDLFANAQREWFMPAFPDPASTPNHASTSNEVAAESVASAEESVTDAVIRRSDSGDSQRVIADALGISQPTVSRILAAARAADESTDSPAESLSSAATHAAA